MLELNPFKNKMWLELKYNRFSIPVPDDVIILGTMKIIEGKHHLGDEADVFIRYQAFKKWQFTGVFCYFIPGDLEQINFRNTKNASMTALQILFTLN